MFLPYVSVELIARKRYLCNSKAFVKMCVVSMFSASPVVQCVSLDRILCLLERAVKCLICVLP